MSMMNVDTTLSSPQQFELGLNANLDCRILSSLSISFYQDENLSIAWAGQLTCQGAPVNADEFARHYQEHPNLAELYNQLAGRFWLLVVDKQQNCIQLVNDPMSIQPCYYSLQNGCLYVSESLDILKMSEQLSCTLCNQAIYNYFYFHCIPAPDTIYQECSKLEPANLLSFDSEGRVTTRNCFRPHFAKQIEDQKAAQHQCLDVIDKAVKQQMSGHCGAFLSGGLDSSTVAGMLARHDENAKTFSIGFEVPEYDETAYAKITAEHFSTQHQVLYLKPEMAAKEFIKVAQYFDEPFGNSSAMAAYFCATFAKSHGIDHLLAGDGGDELFAGNSRYAKQKKFEVFHQAPSALQVLPRLLFSHKPLRTLPLTKKIGSYIEQADVPLPDRLETYNFIQQFGAAQMFDENFLKQVDTEHPIQLKRKRYDECDSVDPVDKMLYLDWKFTLADNDLVKVSKMCELAGVTVDFPLLDRKLIDFSCTIPAEVKLPGGELRDFYKKSCKGFLADATLEKSKHGFGLPFGVWMKENQQLKDLAMQSLQSFRTRNIVKDSLIKQALAAHESVHAGYYGELIWIMVILELWLQGKE
ncbi:asparagine synthetase B family protein [Neptunicella sp. SCSIO 80796]|uniref:asparagine synthetase B family protein n=1 Tax=Neptunicella plasticusilytica TaxID=3117012 RepID=UPI003A4DA220